MRRDYDLPAVMTGHFYPIDDVEYEKAKRRVIYHGPDGPIVLRTRPSTYNAAGRFVRSTGHLLLTRRSAPSKRIYPVYNVDGSVEIHPEHAIYSRLEDYPLTHVLQYEPCNYIDPAWYRLACHFFGQPKDSRYKDFIIAPPEKFREYAECFSYVSNRPP